ncbi:MAG: hypothetical protein JNL73_03210 [Anaerolineales bacterium]|nr:hypothetical protein [Anaerolineales bacterium]
MLTSFPLGNPNAEKWSVLQRPRTATATEPQLLLLMSALDAGWCVEQPVYLRGLMGDRSRRAYHIILNRPGHMVNLITVPHTREAEAFAQREGWQVLIGGY